MKLLVSNVGSTSLKFKLFDMPEERVLSVVGQNVHAGQVIGIVHQRRYLYQHEGHQRDEQQGSSRA